MIEPNQKKQGFTGAKKSLGQNFLKSKDAIYAMIEATKLSPEDIILEIGPGKGVLTEKLLEKAGKVIAVEKDDRLIEELKTRFHTEIENGKFFLFHDDILKIDLEKIIGDKENYKIVANIPYYITGQLLRIFLSKKHQPQSMTLMLQKEVAQRIVSNDKKESLLSISVKVYGTPKYIFKVSKKYFSPQPKVDSAILLIKDISKNFFSDISEEKFFDLLKAGFAHKRKQLFGNLKEKYKTAEWGIIFSAVNLDKKTRAEKLSLEHWKYLASKI